MSEPEANSSASALRAIEAKPTLLTYLSETWGRLPFAAHFAWYQVFSENSRLKMGLSWVIMRPVINALIYGLIFGLLLGSGKPDNFIAFLLVGVFFYEFFSSTLLQGARAVINNESLIKTISFPKLSLVVSNVIRQLINISFVFAVLAVMLLIFNKPFSLPTWSWLMVFPIMAIFTLFCLGFSAILARLTVHFRDLTSFLPFIIRLGLYASGVIFPLEKLLKGHPRMMAVFEWNPVHSFLNLARGALLPDYELLRFDWMVVLVWTAVIFPLGIIFFWKGEMRYGKSS